MPFIPYCIYDNIDKEIAGGDHACYPNGEDKRVLVYCEYISSHRPSLDIILTCLAEPERYSIRKCGVRFG